MRYGVTPSDLKFTASPVVMSDSVTTHGRVGTTYGDWELVTPVIAVSAKAELIAIAGTATDRRRRDLFNIGFVGSVLVACEECKNCGAI
jgi:hypothetical protein